MKTKAEKREKKEKNRNKMKVDGRSVFLLQKIKIERK